MIRKDGTNESSPTDSAPAHWSEGMKTALSRYALSIVEGARNPILILNAQRHVEYANSAFYGLLRTTAGETLGKSIFELGGGQWDVPQLQVLIEQLFRKGTAFFDVEIDYVFPEMRPRIFCIEGRRIRDEASEQTRMLLAIEDVTARKHTEQELLLLNKNLSDHAEQLEKANEELQQFAYVASHDLQEPLRMVASYIQLLEKRCGHLLDADSRRFIEYATTGARRMQNLIRDLLSYSRAGRDGGVVELVDMNEIFQQSVHNLARLIEETGASVTKTNLPSVMGDPMQLLQVMQNLIENSLKYRSDVKPVVCINAEKKSNKWVFAVQDNGIGFDPQHSERIFQVFQRLNRRDENAGSGIGLAVAKKIIERHGGEIWAESTPDKGSIFSFALPAPLLVRKS